MKKRKKKQTVGGVASSPPPASPARGASPPCRFPVPPPLALGAELPRAAAAPLAWGAELPQRRRPQRSLDLEKRRLAGGRSSQRRRGARRRRRTSLPRCSPEVGAQSRAARPRGGSGEEREKREGKGNLREREVVGRGIDNITWVWGPPYLMKIDRVSPNLRSPAKTALGYSYHVLIKK